MYFAQLCRAAENEFVGVPCGILDQASSLLGKPWHVMNIDCRSLGVEHLPLLGEAVIVCDSGVRHALVSGAYRRVAQALRSRHR